MLRLVCTFVYLVSLVVLLLTTKDSKDTKEILRPVSTFVYLVSLVVPLLTTKSTKDTVYITMRRMPSFRCGTLKLMIKPNLKPVALR